MLQGACEVNEEVGWCGKEVEHRTGQQRSGLVAEICWQTLVAVVQGGDDMRLDEHLPSEKGTNPPDAVWKESAGAGVLVYRTGSCNMPMAKMLPGMMSSITERTGQIFECPPPSVIRVSSK